MKSLLCLAILAIVALVANGSAQDSKKQPAKAEITQAMYTVTGLH